MKRTLGTSEIVNELRNDQYAGWSYEGAKALAEYFEQYEECIGEELEFDVVAISCDFSESESLQDWAIGYFGDNWKDQFDIENENDEDEINDAIEEYISDRGELISFCGGVIVSSF